MYAFIEKANTEIDSGLVESEISALEGEYGIVFPPVLKDYYTAFDASEIKVCVILTDEYEFEVSDIIPICGEELTFREITNENREDGWISKDFYPLAMNEGGDLYYWSTQSGYVFFLPNDHIEHPVKVCNSIGEFFYLMEHGIEES